MYLRFLALICSIGFILLSCVGCGATAAVPPAATPSPTATATPIATPTPSGQPDLLPVPGPSDSFCRFDSNGNVLITIKNQGAAAAGPSTTAVKITGQFTSALGSGAFGGTFTGMTPAIPAGQSVDVSINVLPLGGNILSATIMITVDSTHQVAESNEANNTIHAQC